MILLPEVTDINKQRFLAELGKLLTFMYEEDRQTALTMYGKMFDDAEDEQALLQQLVSPTRQAVVVARAYDAKERKLQVQTQSREEDGAERDRLPGFMLAINKIYEDVVPRETDAAPVMRDQVSLFEAPADDAQDDAPAAAAPIADDAARETLSALTDAMESAERAEAPQTAPDGELGAPDESAAEAPAGEAPEALDEVDSFLEEFHIEDAAAQAPEERAEELGDLVYETPAVRTRPRTGLLILFWILGVPLAVIGIVLLLVPTLAALGVAVGLIASGSAAVIAAFSGFAVFADILLVLGIAIILLALGLLFLWLFIWLIGGGMVGLVRGLAALSRKWCYEEVPA